MGVDALADLVVSADLGGAEVFHERDVVRAGHLVHGEVRQIDHADVGAHFQVLGVRDAPEMAVVPFVLADRHLIGVLLQQVFVAGIAVGPLPPAELHEIAAERRLALVERTAAHASAAGEGLARMDRRIVDLHRGFAAPRMDEIRVGLEGIEARIVDRVMIDLGASVGHPVDQQLGHAGAVLDPDRDAIPETADLLAFADRRTAVGGHLEQTVERSFFVVAQFLEDRRQFHCARQRFHHLVDVQVALRGRKAGVGRLQNILRVAEARFLFLVVPPFDHAALGGLGIAGVAHVGGVALIAEKRPADLLAGTGECVVGAEPQKRMVDRHDGQVLAGHGGDETAPQPGADDDALGPNCTARRFDALDPPILDDQAGGGRVGERLELAAVLRVLDQNAGDRLGARHDKPGMGIPQAASHPVLLDQRKLFLDLGRGDQPHIGPEGLAGSDLALDLVHPGIIADPGDLEPAHLDVVPHPFEEIDGVAGRPARQEIMAGPVTEIGGVRGRADVGRDRRFVDADDIVPAPLDQVVGNGRSDDTAQANDDDVRSFRKLCH